MPGTDHSPDRRARLRALAVMGLLAGLIGMHHLLAASPPVADSMSTSVEAAMSPAAVPAGQMPAGQMAAGQMAAGHGDAVLPLPVPSGDHGSGDHGSAVLHLCLAVLTVAAVVVLGWLLWRHSAGVNAAVAVRVVRACSTPRAPPRGASARLAVLCVSRT